MTSIRTIALAVLIAAGTAGCFKLKQAVTVMPDGSGKLAFTIAINEKQIKEALKGLPGAGGQAKINNDPTDVDWAGLEDISEGIVAFTEPETWTTADGWKYVKYTAYFEDLNKVKLFHKPEKKEEEGAKKVRLSFVFKKEKKGYYLECLDSVNPDPKKGERAGQVPPEAEAFVFPMMKELFKGMEMERAFMLPGEISKAEEITEKKGRVASSKITSEGITELAALKKMGEAKHFKIWCGKSKVSDIEAAAFQTELERARENWEAMKKKVAAAKKKAEEARKVEEKEGVGEGD